VFVHHVRLKSRSETPFSRPESSLLVFGFTAEEVAFIRAAVREYSVQASPGAKAHLDRIRDVMKREAIWTDPR